MVILTVCESDKFIVAKQAQLSFQRWSDTQRWKDSTTTSLCLQFEKSKCEIARVLLLSNPSFYDRYGTPSAFVSYRINLPPLSKPGMFRADTPPELWRMQLNSWPYALPSDVQHVLCWTRLQLVDRHAMAQEVWDDIVERGLSGLTGYIPPALGESERLGSHSTEPGSVGWEMRQFVLRFWPQDDFDTALRVPQSFHQVYAESRAAF